METLDLQRIAGRILEEEMVAEVAAPELCQGGDAGLAELRMPALDILRDDREEGRTPGLVTEVAAVAVDDPEIGVRRDTVDAREALVEDELEAERLLVETRTAMMSA